MKTKFDHINVFVNNAGILNESMWEKTVEINLVSVNMRGDKPGKCKDDISKIYFKLKFCWDIYTNSKSLTKLWPLAWHSTKGRYFQESKQRVFSYLYDNVVAPITQLRNVRNKIVTFKGGHLMW